MIQADGGTRTASITGAYVAFSRAIRALQKKGQADQGTPVLSHVAAVSVGVWWKGAVSVDLDYVEDSAAEVDLNVVALEGRQAD